MYRPRRPVVVDCQTKARIMIAPSPIAHIPAFPYPSVTCLCNSSLYGILCPLQVAPLDPSQLKWYLPGIIFSRNTAPNASPSEMIDRCLLHCLQVLPPFTKLIMMASKGPGGTAALPSVTSQYNKNELSPGPNWCKGCGGPSKLQYSIVNRTDPPRSG